MDLKKFEDKKFYNSAKFGINVVTSGEEGFSELEIIKMLFFLNTNIPITSDHVGCRLEFICR